MIEVRLVAESDLNDFKAVLDTIELFPPEMLDDMISDYFYNRDSEEIWFTATQNRKPVSIGYCAPEKLTNGTFNLYAIGVRSDIQGKGTGGKMMDFIESHLKQAGHRILIVDTSGTEGYRSTREFYEKLGHSKEATIRDFWDEGNDKVVF